MVGRILGVIGLAFVLAVVLPLGWLATALAWLLGTLRHEHWNDRDDVLFVLSNTTDPLPGHEILRRVNHLRGDRWWNEMWSRGLYWTLSKLLEEGLVERRDDVFVPELDEAATVWTARRREASR